MELGARWVGLIWLGVFLSVGVARGDWRKDDRAFRRSQLKELPQVESVTEMKNWLLIRVRNATTESFRYEISELSSPMDFYWEEKISGRWQGTMWPWCGTGLEPKVLRPGGELTMRILEWTEQHAYRVYWRVENLKGDRAGFVLLWEGK